MLRATLLSLVAVVLVPALAAQVPLGSGHGQVEQYPAIFGDEDIAEWNLEKIPNPDTTDHLVFETVHSLLQHWPNTRMRNGELTGRLPGSPCNTSTCRSQHRTGKHSERDTSLPWGECQGVTTRPRMGCYRS